MLRNLFSRDRPREDAATYEEQRARIEKLYTETALLKLQLTPRERAYERLKVIAGVSGVLTGIAALLGLFLSAYQWFRSENLNRQVRVEERLERALKLLGDEKPATRLAGVITLASFLREADDTHAPQVLLALTNTIGIEASLPVRNAILATFEDAEVSTSVRPHFNRALGSLAQVSRGLVNEGDLWRTRRQNLWHLPPHDSVESRAVSVATAMAIMLRKGARTVDLTGVYLPATDLKGISLPGVRLDDSILAWSNFREANLVAASFKDADLERTNFIEANLERADFSHTDNIGSSTMHHNYVNEQLMRVDQSIAEHPELGIDYSIDGPDFECANLKDSNFANHPIVPIYVDEDQSGVALAPRTTLSTFSPKFHRANIANVNFMSVTIFGILPAGSLRFSGPYPSGSGGSSYSPGAEQIKVHATIIADKPLGKPEGFTDAVQTLGYLFEGANWDKAKLPKSLRDALALSRTSNVPRPPCRQVRPAA